MAAVEGIISSSSSLFPFSNSGLKDTESNVSLSLLEYEFILDLIDLNDY